MKGTFKVKFSYLWIILKEIKTYFYFKPYCNQKQVWLPASMKANTQDSGAEWCKGKWFIWRCWDLEDGGLTSQSPSPHLSGGGGF